MMEETKRATILGIIINTVLLVLKIIASVITGNIAIISDTINSFMDVVSSVVTHIAVALSKRKADKGYPLGYRRAEPVAALIIALLAAILSFEILRSAITGIITGVPIHIPVTLIPVVILFAAILAKIIMSSYYGKLGKKYDSPALRASSVDYKSDILSSVIALVGFLGTSLKIYYLDDVAAIIVAIIIFYAGYKTGIQNLDYLMGKSPDDSTLFEIKKRALGVEGVRKIDEVRAHYVGNYAHVELKIQIDKTLSAYDAHQIAEKVRKSIEAISHIDKAYVHLDPV